MDCCCHLRHAGHLTLLHAFIIYSFTSQYWMRAFVSFIICHFQLQTSLSACFILQSISFYHVWFISGTLTSPRYDFTGHAIRPDHGLWQWWRFCGHTEATPGCPSSCTVPPYHRWYPRSPSRPLELKNETQGYNCHPLQHYLFFWIVQHKHERANTRDDASWTSPSLLVLFHGLDLERFLHDIGRFILLYCSMRNYYLKHHERGQLISNHVIGVRKLVY